MTQASRWWLLYLKLLVVTLHGRGVLSRVSRRGVKQTVIDCKACTINASFFNINFRSESTYECFPPCYLANRTGAGNAMNDPRDTHTSHMNLIAPCTRRTKHEPVRHFVHSRHHSAFVRWPSSSVRKLAISAAARQPWHRGDQHFHAPRFKSRACARDAAQAPMFP
jgi:hypothetical protein